MGAPGDPHKLGQQSKGSSQSGLQGALKVSPPREQGMDGLEVKSNGARGSSP